MLEAIENFPETGDVPIRLSFIPSFYEDKGYVFLQLKCPPGDNCREVRQHMLKIACGAARNRFSHLEYRRLVLQWILPSSRNTGKFQKTLLCLTALVGRKRSRNFGNGRTNIRNF